MKNSFSSEPMLDVFLSETTRNLKRLREIALKGGKSGRTESDAAKKALKLLREIKTSAEMMMHDSIAALASSMEGLFYGALEAPGTDPALLSEFVLKGVNLIQTELEEEDGTDDSVRGISDLMEEIDEFLSSSGGKRNRAAAAVPRETPPSVQQYYLSSRKSDASPHLRTYEAVLYFEEGCEMENIRAYTILHSLKEIAGEYSSVPEDVIADSDSVYEIREKGFQVTIRSEKSPRELKRFFKSIPAVREWTLIEKGDLFSGQLSMLQNKSLFGSFGVGQEPGADRAGCGQFEIGGFRKGTVSVDAKTLGKLSDLIEEIAVAEAMVTQNPELRALRLPSFDRASRRLRQTIDEAQEMILSLRRASREGYLGEAPHDGEGEAKSGKKGRSGG